MIINLNMNVLLYCYIRRRSKIKTPVKIQFDSFCDCTVLIQHTVVLMHVLRMIIINKYDLDNFNPQFSQMDASWVDSGHLATKSVNLKEKQIVCLHIVRRPR